MSRNADAADSQNGSTHTDAAHASAGHGISDDPAPRSRTVTNYELIGGAGTVKEAVERFYALVLTDPELSPYFVDVDMPQLKRHQVLLLSQVLGGPAAHDGRDLAEAHAGLGISEKHYRTAVHYLTGVLWNLGAGERVVTAVGLALAQLQERIVGRTTETTTGHDLASVDDDNSPQSA